MTILNVYISLSEDKKIEEELRESANLSPEELAQLVDATKVEHKEKKEQEEAQFKKLLEDSPSRKDLTFDDYQKLLKLTRLAYVREQNGVPEEHAIKLLEAFGNYDAAIEYLKRYEAAHPSRPQLIHDACLFALPSDKYNVELWQQLNQRYMPNERYEKTLSLAPEIESHVLEHRKALEALARQQIISGQETRLGDEWERAKKEKETKGYDEFYQNNKKRLEKRIQELVDKKVSTLAFNKLKAQPGFLQQTKDERNKALREFNESQEGKSLRKKLTSEIQSEQEKVFKEEYEKIQSANVAKQDYIKNKLDDPELQKIIEGNIKDAKKRVLSENTSVETLYGYLSQCSYKNASKNPKAAALFFEYGISELFFDNYLALKISDTSNIPEVFIDGGDIGYPGFYLKKLSKSDPTCAIAGKMTSCCQWMGGAGGECAVHAIMSPNGDIYGLYQKRGEKPGNDDMLLAQTWAWLSTNNNIVFDSIESQIDFRRKNGRMLSDFFVLLAHQLTTEKGIPKVHLGKGASPHELLEITTESDTYKDYSGYKDSSSQSLLSSPLFMRYYFENHPDSKLQKTLKDMRKPTKNEIFDWIEFCAMSDRQELLGIFKKTDKPDDIEDFKKAINEHFAISKSFLNALENEDLKTAMELVHKGANIQLIFKRFGFIKISILSLALQESNYDAMKEIFRLGFPLNKLDLSYATLNNLQLSNFIKFLIEENIKNVNDEINFSIKSYDRFLGSTYLQCAINTENLELFKYLIENGADINKPDRQGRTPLHYAAQANNLDMVKYLIEHGAIFPQLDNQGKTAIDASLDAKAENLQKPQYQSTIPPFNNKILIEYLFEFLETQKGEVSLPKNYVLNKKFLMATLEMDLKGAMEYVVQGADFSSKMDDLLKLAFSQRDLSSIQYLVENKQVDLNSLTLDPIAFAIANNDSDILKYLLENQKINLKIPEHLELAFSYFKKNKPNAAMYLLKNKRMDINFSDLSRNTFLLHAAKNNNLEQLKFFLTQGANINHINNRFESALAIALENGFSEIAQYLVEQGAKLDATIGGYSPITIAIGRNDPVMLKYLVDHGASLQRIKNQANPIFRGIQVFYESGHQNITVMLKFLIEQCNFDINSPVSWQGETLLQLFINDLEIRQYLIEKGANLNQTDDQGKTVLHHLTNNPQNLEIIKFLVEHGANPSIRDKQGNTAKDIALNAKAKNLSSSTQSSDGTLISEVIPEFNMEPTIEFLKAKENEQKVKAELPLLAFDLARKRDKAKADEESKTQVDIDRDRPGSR